MMKESLLNLDIPQLEEWFIQKKQPAFRVSQLLNWIYRKHSSGFDSMSDFPRNLREMLAHCFLIDDVAIEREFQSKDGTIKIRLLLQDSHSIETVLIPHEGHQTICVSSQAGCALGCRFCATASLGIIRNLKVSEILSQILIALRMLDSGVRSNIVFMGMGEPLLNSANVVSAINRLTDELAFGWAASRITVSTSGIIPELQRFLSLNLKVNIALSLNAADDKTRSRLMPVNHKYPIKQLVSLLKNHPYFTSQNPLMIEYIMLKGINDSEESALRLTKLFDRRTTRINLIPFNIHSEGRLKPSEPDQIETFRQILIDKGFTAIVRKSHGSDIHAACGQLAGFWETERKSGESGC